jgi:hypothetical protein
MKRGFGWILAWLIVCLLLSLGLQASGHHELQVAGNRSGERSKELVSLSSSRITSIKFIHSRAAPRESFLALGLFGLFWIAEDLGALGPPWLDYRGPPGTCCGPRVNRTAAGHTGSTKARGRACFLPEIPARQSPKLKT